MTEEKIVFVCNIPFEAIATNVVETLSGFGPIISCDLPHKNNEIFGYGFVEFENKEDAADSIEFTARQKLLCLGRALRVSLSNSTRHKKTKWNHVNEDVFNLSSLEIGNWGGQSIVHTKRKEQSAFLKEWKYPEYYEKPRVYFSETSEAFILEGFNLSKDSHGTNKKKRVKIPFHILEDTTEVFKDEGDGVISLYISLKHPPYLYREALEKETTEIENAIGRFSWEQIDQGHWIRTIDWTGIVNVFGRCLVYRLIFRDELNKLNTVLNNLKAKGVPRPIPQYSIKVIDKPIYSKEYLEDSAFQVLPFRICYKLESLISQGTLTFCEIRESNMLERLSHLILFEEQEIIAWHALNQISTKYWDPFDKKYQDRPISIFETAIKNFKSEFTIWHPSNPNLKLTNNTHCAWVNHATITPTKIYFDGPNYEQSNRILRLYEDKIDRFLRITFTEEDLDRMFVNKFDDVDIINLRIMYIMTNGFNVAGRHYEFLAFSSSQLQDTSCWFVATDGEFNANFIRAHMGDFSQIKAPALYASRMGQCFTSTIGTLELSQNQVDYTLEEIERNDFKFSDGCGKISESLAKRAAKEYWGTKKPKDEEIPSVFQIRFGGCKGMVAVDPNLEGDVLCIRPSQEKFKAESSILEIVKSVRTPLPGHLNKQIILILSAHGVPDHVFIQLQNKIRKDIDSMMTNEDQAREIVKRGAIVRECSHIARTMLSMIGAGMMRGTDPFLKAILECTRVYALKTLRQKARILMPNSYILLGVIDETGILEEDEIFVQTSTIINENLTFDKKNDKILREHKIWKGPAVITRNPCLHPGDLRKAEAVDVPELHHLRNCVVFSQKGYRPLPNCLSGGDLDGDTFFVCFDERIFITENEDPMEFDSQGRRELDRDVEIGDICEFFKDYMLNNRLGQIANLHSVFADFTAEGVKSNECIKLAEMHSNAVDFNKTGYPVLNALPTMKEYPDFMENQFKESYESNKVLGKLYRNIQLDLPGKDPLLKYKETAIDEDFVYDGYQDYIEDAIACRDYYNDEIRKLMRKYNVKTEVEVLTAQLLGLRNNDSRKAKEKRKSISGTSSFIIYHYRKLFLMNLQEAHNIHNTNDEISPFNLDIHIPINEKSKAKASAWYIVTYTQGELPYNGKNKITLLSFPWVVSDVLLAIRRNKLLKRLN
ncbi:4586_t:CDS:2 [Funneliformis geosporum]|uniref:RNA-dependent RNA polymerase n=1 Tax=Funneliformis geosporum TaxID=1117311 RepID=A0A9W4SJS1_9GLOM|nr:4586_t:CDS:2 [Funneliformis geosporum]CAI2171645.1 10492_t:CDS:2 [Funneliformis geosporum]